MQNRLHHTPVQDVADLRQRLIDAHCKGKGKGLDTCYSATYMSQTRDQ